MTATLVGRVFPCGGESPEENSSSKPDRSSEKSRDPRDADPKRSLPQNQGNRTREATKPAEQPRDEHISVSVAVSESRLAMPLNARAQVRHVRWDLASGRSGFFVGRRILRRSYSLPSDFNEMIPKQYLWRDALAQGHLLSFSSFHSLVVLARDRWSTVVDELIKPSSFKVRRSCTQRRPKAYNPVKGRR